MTRSEFRHLAARKILLLDGATGTELVKRGLPAGVCPELWVAAHPEAICDIHRAYINAGSDIVYAPTFGGNRCKLAEFGLDGRLHELVCELVKIAKANAPDALVFGDISSTGKFVEPFGELPFDEAVAVFREAAQAMVAGGADGIAIETMMDLQEARAALLGVREAAPELPVIVTMTFEPNGLSLTGAHPAAALNALQALGADAFGCNCSSGPQEMAQIIAQLRPYAKIPLIAKPNAGLPHLDRNGKTVFPMDAAEFGSYAAVLADAGASILGGCCGTTPGHIAQLAEAAETLAVPPGNTPVPLVSSVNKFVPVTVTAPFTVIGERINPTGKKAFQAELREGKTDMVLDFALQQSAAGAAILDVNMGLAGIDEKTMMLRSLTRLLKTVPAPLCIDSTDAATVEAALRLYPGRALLNSISAEKKRLTGVLPIAAKYGAMLILLPLTDEGIPATAAERMAVTETILAECRKYGYSEQDVCVDALIMAVSADPDAANTALEFISMCHARGIPTVCGLSNVSFGMPNRALLNQTFLGMAMGRGLNLAIANPLSGTLMEMALAGNALRGLDPKMAVFLDKFAGTLPEKTAVTAEKSPQESLTASVLLGDKDAVPGKVRALLDSGMAPEAILNDVLIPAITEVGRKYEAKEFFLPQLIAGAEAMQSGTAVLETLLCSGGTAAGTKQKMILATVKGDIHDIGKNIVAVVMRNYGFDVIDLGKDVPPEVILDHAAANQVKLIGLSALMTTTMGAMRETVALAKQRNMDVKFIVGGAVVDQLFADEIGAAYAGDPMSAVRCARQLLD
ncbi:MAG: 5-methyltetrahydrofolate--homocysteine methyltransferase [Lentisphaerae bacterium]|nr:5-methyltetrahydrofolate--homocysteine methyltransferase [Lentisphaerota bacterium]